MTSIPLELRRLVISRVAARCEYCRHSQAGQEATFHIDHIHPRAAGGPTTLDNPALACVSCSLHKAARVTATDPDSGTEVPLFNPRSQSWNDHFRRDNDLLVPLSPIGRATLIALHLNRPLVLAIRREEIAIGGHPP